MNIMHWMESTFDTDEDMPMARHIVLISIISFCVLFILWANLAKLDEVTRGEGRIIPSSEVQALQSLEAGIVEEFLVQEGDEVEAGQVVMRLSDIEASSDLGAIKRAIWVCWLRFRVCRPKPRGYPISTSRRRSKTALPKACWRKATPSARICGSWMGR